MNHPKHLDFYNLFNYLKYDNWYYTLKIDGVNVTHSETEFNKNSIRYKTKQSLYHIINLIRLKYPDYNYVEAEYVNNIIFIFDKISKITNEREIVGSNTGSLIDLIYKYNELILADQNEIVIIEKPYFKITNKLVTLKYLYSLVNDETLNNFADGFILTNFKYSFKIKPLNKLSIDLLYRNNHFFDSDNNKYDITINSNLTNNKIYQLSFNNSNNNWQVDRCRVDKSKPNNKILTTNAICYIKYYDKFIEHINNLIINDKFYKKYYQNNYYDMKVSDYNFIENHKIVTNEWLHLIKQFNLQNNIMFNGILDLGCGSGYTCSNNFTYDNWLGIDIDYQKILKIHESHLGKMKYLLKDLNSAEEDFNHFQEPINYDKYDTLIMINSCHYFQTEPCKEFIKKFNIKNVYIVTIDPLYIRSIADKIENNIATFIHPKSKLVWKEPLFDLEYWSNIFIKHTQKTEFNLGNEIEDIWFKNHKLIIYYNK